MTDLSGRHPIHGVAIGILMLDTGFERIPGDIGNALTWPFPVHYKIVKGITGKQVLSENGGGTLDHFIAAANELVEIGVSGITTSCGFLALFQKDLSERCKVPIMTSSLQQIPMVMQLLKRGQRVGILTASSEALTERHFSAIGCPTDLPVVGIDPASRFRHEMLSNSTHIDRAAQEKEVLRMGKELMDKHQDVGAIISECTNLAPYSASLAAAYGLPVFDVVTMVRWFHAGLRPAIYT